MSETTSCVRIVSPKCFPSPRGMASFPGAASALVPALTAGAPNTGACATSRRHPFSRRCTVRSSPSGWRPGRSACNHSSSSRPCARARPRASRAAAPSPRPTGQAVCARARPSPRTWPSVAPRRSATPRATRPRTVPASAGARCRPCPRCRRSGRGVAARPGTRATAAPDRGCGAGARVGEQPLVRRRGRVVALLHLRPFSGLASLNEGWKWFTNSRGDPYSRGRVEPLQASVADRVPHRGAVLLFHPGLVGYGRQRVNAMP